MINRSESQLIARDHNNQVLKASGKRRKGATTRGSAPVRQNEPVRQKKAS